MTVTLDSIRECFEGLTPSTMATADLYGTPNLAYLSQVQYIDTDHVALSYQFFNKTRQNILVNPHASLIVIHAATGAQYRLSILYLRTETAGPLFESMKAKLAGIASHTGMSGVFRLLGSDVYRVDDIMLLKGESLPVATSRRNLLAALRKTSERVALHCDLDKLLNETLACLDSQFAIRHAMISMYDEPRARLYTVASRGYAESGVGSEIPIGQGVIGVAARERTPIRISHMNAEYAYCRAIRESAIHHGMADALETEIPLPGLAESRSQLAVPIVASRRMIGVLYVESPVDLGFSYDDEDALVALCAQLGLMIAALQAVAEAEEDVPTAVPPGCDSAAVPGKATLIRHYPENNSVFIDDDYLIKGVAGSILATLLHDYIDKSRSEFSNRELRLDPRIRLPDVSDNLEARLILLSRRLDERNACVRLEKTGRGRFRLCVNQPITMVEGSGNRSA